MNESKTWILKPHSHTSNGLAMDRRRVKKSGAKTLQQGQEHIEDLPRAASVAEGGRMEMALRQ